MGSKLNSTWRAQKENTREKKRGETRAGAERERSLPFPSSIFRPRPTIWTPGTGYLRVRHASVGDEPLRKWGKGRGLPCIFNNLTTHSKQAGDGNKNSIMASWFLPPLFRLTLYSLYRYLIASGIIDLKQTFFWLVTHSSVTGTRDEILITSAWEVMDIKGEHF